MRLCYFGDAGSIHIVRWCTHFASLGHEVHLISFSRGEIPGIHTHCVDAGQVDVDGGTWRVLLKRNAVRSLVRAIKPDVFHALYATSYGFTGALVGFHPFVITALGSDVLIAPQSSRLYRALVRFALGRADWVTAMADHMRDTIVGLGINQAKITTVPFGIDPTVFFDEEQPRPTDRFIVASSRNFEAVYNVGTLIDAVALAREAIPTLAVRLIGSGSQQSALEDAVRRRQLTDIVQFVGRVTPAVLAHELNQAHVFVSVSSSDGNNVSLNEAMACGAFPIVTDIPANTQWIEDGTNGRLVGINDARGLADRLTETFHAYDRLSAVATPVNKRIVADRAIWSANMTVVEAHYRSMIDAT